MIIITNKMTTTILSHPFFVEQILPFLLVFTLVFAILDKTKILGDGKRQINAIVGLVIGLMVIAFPTTRELIVNLMPLLAVLAVIFLIFIMLYAFVSQDKEFQMPRGLKITFGIIIALALAIGLLVLTDSLDFLLRGIGTGDGSTIAINVFFVLIIVGAIIAVLYGGKSSSGE